MDSVAKQLVPAPAQPQPIKGKSKTPLMLIIMLILMLGMGYGAFIMGKKTKEKELASKLDVNAEIVADAAGAVKAAEAAKAESKEGEKGKEGENAGKEGEKGDAAANQKKELRYLFDQFTVNLSEPDPRYYLQLTISVELASADVKKKIEDNLPGLREATNLLLSSKTKAEANSSEGKERMKRELIARYEGLIGTGTINTVYLNEPHIFYQ